MRCLYCGKHLALFRKLTGGGEFCSDAHRRSYQDEYNRLALSRLLQSQTAGDDAPPAEKLPEASQKPRARAGTVLGLEVMPTRPQQSASPAPVASDERVRALMAPSDSGSAPRDAKRRAGFVPTSLSGHVDASAMARAQVQPCPGVDVLEIGAHTPEAMTPAMPAIADACLRLTVSHSIAPDIAVPRRDSLQFASDMQPMLADWRPNPVVNGIPVEAPRIPLKLLRDARALTDSPRVRYQPLRVERYAGVPETAAQFSGLVLPEAQPVTLAVAGAVADEGALHSESPVGFGLTWGFADTLMTGFVGGMRLGGERIRFELGDAASASQANFENAVDQHIVQAEERILPHQFIAAVQEAAIPQPVAENAAAEATLAVEAVPVKAEIIAEKVGERMCGWLPVTMAPASVATRQRLMQTFQAIGIASGTPVPPHFEMLTVRPSFVLGTAPAEAPPEPEIIVPIVAEAAHVNGSGHEEPAEAVAVSVAEAKPLSAEDRVYASTVQFLEHYEKKKSGFSRLLGKIGIG